MTVFITRTLGAGSKFKELLSRAGWKVEGESLVEFSPLPFREIPRADWIFFTSQNAVRFFFENIENQNLAIPKSQWAALGEATARALAERVGRVDFTGAGDPAATAAAFKSQFHSKGSVILFPAARHSRLSLQSMLEPDFICIRLEVYDNLPVAEPPFSDAEVLVFTSPMNAETYFSKHTLLTFQRVIAIGQTTADALKALGIAGVRVSIEPSEQALAEAVLRLKD